MPSFAYDHHSCVPGVREDERGGIVRLQGGLLASTVRTAQPRRDELSLSYCRGVATVLLLLLLLLKQQGNDSSSPQPA